MGPVVSEPLRSRDSETEKGRLNKDSVSLFDTLWRFLQIDA